MKTQCPHCKVKFNTNDANAGRQAKCPKCAKPFTIYPIAEAPAQPAPTPPAPKPAPAPPETPKPAPTPPAATPPKSPQPQQAPPEEPLSAPPAQKPEQPAAAPQKAIQKPAPSAAAPQPAAPAAKSPQAPPQKPQPAPAPPAQQAPPKKAAEPAVEEAAPKACPKKTLSKLLYVYGWLATRLITGILAAVGLMLALGQTANSTVLATFAATDLFLLAGVAIELLLFYKMWDAIPTTQASTSPGKAVAFLFIPGFNIYWALLMLTAFAEDCNAQLRRSPAQVKELPAMLYAAHAFTFLLSGIFIVIPLLCTLFISHFVNRVSSNVGDLFLPLVGFAAVIGLAHLVTYILVAMKTCTAVNALQGE